MNVVSLFDGMSCGQQALERAGIVVDNYFASEVDKYAIKVTQHNYPNTKQLGDVRLVDPESMPVVQLLIGGSPCQSFSFAGKRKGMSTKDSIEILTLEHYLELKEQNFEFEGQSYLFWEYIRVLTALRKKNPDIKFLLENVMMGEKWQRILTQAIGINPIEINSSLVSAQNRRRLYWTNIGAQADGLFGDLKCMIKRPKDKGILLKDILESEVGEKYFLSDKMIIGMLNHTKRQKENGRGYEFKPSEGKLKAKCLRANSFKMGADDNYIGLFPYGKSQDQKISIGKSQTLSAGHFNQPKVIVHNMMPRSGNPLNGGTGHLTRTDGKTYCLDTGNTNAVEILSGTLRTHKDGNGFREVKSGKGATIPARAREDGSGQNVVSIDSKIRRLTPVECERLQTVKDNYTSIVSDTQRYRMLGNGWTVEVIAHIFSSL